MMDLFYEMKMAEKYLTALLAHLKKVEKIYSNESEKAPQGFVYCSEQHGYQRFGYKEPKRKAKYLSLKREEDKKLIKLLSQKAYLKILIPRLQEMMDFVSKVLPLLDTDEIIGIYQRLPQYRKKEVTALLLPDEEYLDQWIKAEYTPKEIENSNLVTNRGEQVRSKSEVIIANALDHYEIPYRYEAPLTIGNITLHPDFTILNKRTRQEYYLEHLGMMDNEGYINSALKRLQLYESNGIRVGEKLILTYESSTVPLNVPLLNQKIQRYFM